MMILAQQGREVATMLVLSRKLNEQILIGDGIVITVVAIRGGQVRLGIEAPRQMPISRKPPRPIGKQGQSGSTAGSSAADLDTPQS